jgi:hypothetical protein
MKDEHKQESELLFLSVYVVVAVVLCCIWGDAGSLFSFVISNV